MCLQLPPPCPPSPSLPPVLQADAGAQAVQIFDSWAAQLSPMDFDVFAGPYLHYIIKEAKKVSSHLGWSPGLVIWPPLRQACPVSPSSAPPQSP